MFYFKENYANDNLFILFYIYLQVWCSLIFFSCFLVRCYNLYVFIFTINILLSILFHINCSLFSWLYIVLQMINSPRWQLPLRPCSPSSVTRGHTPHDISTHGDPTFSITTPVSINNASTSITDSSATLIRTRATSTLTSTVSEGHIISRITPLDVTPTSLISENVSSTTNTDNSFDKGIGDELDYLFILIVMPLLFIMCVLVLRLKRRKNVNIVDKSLEM